MNTKLLFGALICIIRHHLVGLVDAVNICDIEKHGVYGAFCENIYVWSVRDGDFRSLFNVSFGAFQRDDLDAFNGRTIRVIADNMPPYITSSNYSHQLGGYLGDIWDIIQAELKFKSNVSSVNYDTGLKIMEAGKADIMLAAAVVKADLLNVEYSQPYFYNWYHLYVKQPEAKASSASYLKTFSAKLWFFSLLAFVILALSLWLTSNFLNRSYRAEPRVSLPSCFLAIVSGFINQGFDLKLRTLSSRIQSMFAFMFGIMLYAAMNAVLVAQLAVFEVPFPFDSLAAISRARSHSLCLRTNSFVYNNFTRHHQTEILPEWRGILNTPPCLDINNQTNLANILCEERLLVLENRVIMATVQKQYPIPCKIINHGEKYFERGNSFLLMKGLENKHLINSMLKKIKSTGVMQRLENLWVRKDQFNRDVYTKTSTHPVTMDHINGILALYAVMILLSLIILCVEIGIYKTELDRTSV